MYRTVTPLPIEWNAFKFFVKVYADKSIKLSKADFTKPKNLDPNLEMDCSKYDDKPLEGNNEENEFDN